MPLPIAFQNDACSKKSALHLPRLFFIKHFITNKTSNWHSMSNLWMRIRFPCFTVSSSVCAQHSFVYSYGHWNSWFSLLWSFNRKLKEVFSGKTCNLSGSQQMSGDSVDLLTPSMNSPWGKVSDDMHVLSNDLKNVKQRFCFRDLNATLSINADLFPKCVFVIHTIFSQHASFQFRAKCFAFPWVPWVLLAQHWNMIWKSRMLWNSVKCCSTESMNVWKTDSISSSRDLTGRVFQVRRMTSTESPQRCTP